MVVLRGIYYISFSIRIIYGISHQTGERYNKNVCKTNYYIRMTDVGSPKCIYKRATHTFHVKMNNAVIRFPQRKLQLVVSIFTGHCELNRHLKIIDLRSNRSFYLCKEAEKSVGHYLGAETTKNRTLETNKIH